MEEKIKSLLDEEVKKHNVYIDNIEYVKESGNYFLRITIDADYIIDIDKCVEVTEAINPILDKVDDIKDSYILDVTTKEKGEV